MLQPAGQHRLATPTVHRRARMRGLSAITIVAFVASLLVVVPVATVAAAPADPPDPVVAIHVSEHTAALETMPATAPTPTGPGTTGMQWWITSWRYFVAYQSLEEALKSDGTPFVEVSDADIAAGRLITADGLPRYPIVISLAAEAIGDDELAPLRGYVSAGGFLLVGSSSFTRTTTGTSRGNFALSSELGLHMTYRSLQDWILDYRFTKTGSSRLTADIPSGTLFWGGVATYDTTPWGNDERYVWQVVADDAQVLATTGAGSVALATKAYGSGRFLYDADLQPLIGDTGNSATDLAYVIYRRAIEWAFESAGMPIVKISPWPYPYDAAGMVRHDLEASTFPGQTTLDSARYEQSLGMKGDYYFTTGTLRISPTNPDTRMTDAQKQADILALRTAVATYGATVGSHNGGLPNPAGYPTPINDANAHTMWHWGPDQALDLSPSGYASGADYAEQSLQISFQDIETWMSASPYAGLTGLTPVDNGRAGCGAAGDCPRTFVSPYHDAGREGSHQILGDLGAQVVGEQKVSPFPLHDFSYLTPHTYFPMIGMGVDNWYINGVVQESIDGYLGTTDMQAAVDWYYSLGALVNLYGHSDLRAYVAYLASKPNLWKTNAVGIHDWVLEREPVRVTPSYTHSGTMGVATATVSGATDAQTAVELVIPGWSGIEHTSVTVKLNGALAPSGTWRATAYGVKIRVGTTVSSVEVDYQAAQAWTQTDWTGGAGQDVWSDPTRYQTATNVDSSVTGQVSLSAATGGAPVFSDTFTRTDGSLAPWTKVSGTWAITNGVLTGAGSGSYGTLYYVPPTSPPSDYAIDARVQQAAASLGGGIGGRLNTSTGARYELWLYPPDGPAANKDHIALVKFSNWTSYSTPALASYTTDVAWHDLRVEFAGNRIRAWVDGSLLIDYTDPTPLSGSGITVDTYPPGSISVDSVSMTTPAAFNTSGTLVSSAFDAGLGSTWRSLSWQATALAGTTVQLRTRTAATSAGLATATWSAWYAESGAPIPDSTGRWLQYQVSLGTADPNITPSLYEVTATYAGSAPADTTPPVVTVPADMSVEATGPSGAVATFTASAVDDVDGVLTPTCAPVSGGTFPVGATTVTCQATDAAGNTGSASFKITVVDTTPPVVTVPTDMSVPATGPSGAVVTFTASASDLIDGVLTPTCAPVSGSTFPVGATTVTCQATDAAGNTGSASFTVTVTAPAEPPAAPTGLTAVVSTVAISLDWIDNTEPDLAGYRVYRSTSSSGPWTLLTDPVLTTSTYVDTTAPTGSTQYYRVTAVDLPGLESAPATTSATRIIAFRASSLTQSSGATTLVVPAPTGMQPGDIMVAVVTVRGGPVISAPSGWTLIRADMSGTTLKQATYYLPVDGSTGASFTWSFSAASVGTGMIVAYSGVDTSGDPPRPVDDASGSATTTFTTSIVAPSVTAGFAGDLLVGAFSSATAATFVPPTDMIEQGQIVATSGRTKMASEITDQVLAAAGATGSREATASKSAVVVGQLIALRPVGTMPPAADTQKPTSPTDLAASASSPTRVDLTWAASTDDVGVDHYIIQRATGTGDFTPVGVSPVPQFTDTSVSKSTTYTYRVLAVDAAGNRSDPSGTATVTTPRRK